MLFEIRRWSRESCCWVEVWFGPVRSTATSLVDAAVLHNFVCKRASGRSAKHHSLNDFVHGLKLCIVRNSRLKSLSGCFVRTTWWPDSHPMSERQVVVSGRHSQLSQWQSNHMNGAAHWQAHRQRLLLLTRRQNMRTQVVDASPNLVRWIPLPTSVYYLASWQQDFFCLTSRAAQIEYSIFLDIFVLILTPSWLYILRYVVLILQRLFNIGIQLCLSMLQVEF